MTTEASAQNHGVVGAATLGQLLASSDTKHGAIRAHLEALDLAERVKQCCALGGKQLARLYEVCTDGAPLKPEDMTVGEGQTVRWQGKNSLPLFTSFQKHFLRQADGKIVGLNHQTMSVVTGPGYFVCRVDDAKPNELLIDYTQVPQSAPAGWPKVTPNESGFSRLVYAGMYDYCRRVTDDVVIGAATKNGKPIGQFFVLCRL